MNDERYKKIMSDLGMPDSVPLYCALNQVANEVAQPLHAEISRLRSDRDLEKRLRKDADDYREVFIEDNHKLRALLTDWQKFAKDVHCADPAGEDWLYVLKGRTKAALEEEL